MFAPNDLGPTVRITAFTLTGLSTLVVAIRFYCRLWIVGKLKSYDWIMSFALLCAWGLCVINHYQMYWGTGQHPMPESPVSENLLPEFVMELLLGSGTSMKILYLVALAVCKISILVFYLSIATHRTFHRVVVATLVLVITVTLILVFLNAFRCPKNPSLSVSPLIFDLGISKNQCFDLHTLYFVQGAFNMATDIIILVAPMPILIRLQLHKVDKIALLGVFSAGVIAPVASGLRIWSLFLWAKDNADSRYNGGYVLFYSQLELNTGIICASFPSLQPIFRRILGELYRAHHRSAYYYYADGEMTLTEANVTQRHRSTIPLSGLEAPGSSYHPTKRDSHSEAEGGLVFTQEMSEEEEIRNRVIHFASQRSSSHSHPPKSPQRPHDILSAG
ncbi:hypothetical protein EJ04DRAFT_430978 [Polyplosphaeria fusca]|uniref:Rhodopsin domain-containing protein n=1 Tax=Polyplosphaeria fusca TaxID=682080 RepID=A0A9P4V2I8_9PLEO|nr:hypothetical protein EJ04DRAFT_430978 [Polyplosphaeria fusca]